MKSKVFYPAEIKCRHCGQVFTDLRPRSSTFVTKKTDSDFCVHYCNGADPLEQYIVVCPRCHYAADKKRFENPPHIRQTDWIAFESKARTMKANVSLSGHRNEVAVDLSFRLAHIWATAEKNNYYYRGILHHRLAWYYRKHARPEQELTELGATVNCFGKAYAYNPYLPENMGPGGFEYLIGDLFRRLNRIDEAIRWLSRSQQVAKRNMLPRIRKLWENACDDTRYWENPR